MTSAGMAKYGPPKIIPPSQKQQSQKNYKTCKETKKYGPCTEKKSP